MAGTIEPHMPWPPCFETDLAAEGVLPDGWRQQVLALADAPDLQRIIDSTDPETGEPWRFEVLQGDCVRERLPWMWDLYHGRMIEFASERFGRLLYPANRLKATLTLNVLTGRGANNNWHRDMNPVTGLLYATSFEEGEGGELWIYDEVDDLAVIRPRAGTFLCFEGGYEHSVTPLLRPGRRVTVAMNFYDSPIDQPEADPADKYL